MIIKEQRTETIDECTDGFMTRAEKQPSSGKTDREIWRPKPTEKSTWTRDMDSERKANSSALSCMQYAKTENSKSEKTVLYFWRICFFSNLFLQFTLSNFFMSNNIVFVRCFLFFSVETNNSFQNFVLISGCVYQRFR